jgi:hypothetical protein
MNKGILLVVVESSRLDQHLFHPALPVVTALLHLGVINPFRTK